MPQPIELTTYVRPWWRRRRRAGRRVVAWGLTLGALAYVVALVLIGLLT